MVAVRFFTFEKWHGRAGIGSTRLRVHQLLKYWPEAALYKYGENPDVLILQKVYSAPDWQFLAHFPGIKILDICDPDWLDGVLLKETLDMVDGVTCPTQPLADFVKQMTDKPVLIVPDRHDLDAFPARAKHKGKIKSVVWFGYKHNAEALRFAMNFLARNNVKLTIISNEDPRPYTWANDQDASQALYTFVPWVTEELNAELVKHDAALLPVTTRPIDRFKSNNRAVIAHLCGLPILTDDISFNTMQNPAARGAEGKRLHAKAVKDYDVRLSVTQLKDFIKSLSERKIDA